MRHDTERNWRLDATGLAGIALGLAAMLFLHRYQGIYHDSILYMGQVLAQWRPESMGHDLFFMYGSQDRYSILPWLLGKMGQPDILPHVFLWGTLTSLALFAFASWHALSALLPPVQRYWAWLATLCLPALYGATRIFSYNESFLTARPFAEGFCLLSVGMLARRRWAAAAGWLLAAWVVHPLQALAACLVLWPWAVARDRRWLHAAWSALPALLLALAGVPPFDGFFARTDPAWLASLGDSWQLFVLDWDPGDYRNLGFDVLLLAAGWRLLGGGLAQWCVAALCGLALGMGASLVLVDGLHLVLPTSLQLWRVHWIAHFLAIAAFAALLWKHLQDRDPARALLLALVGQLTWSPTGFGWIELALVYGAWPWLVNGTRSRLKPYLGAVFIVGLGLLIANHVASELAAFATAGHRLASHPIDFRLFALPVLALGLPLFGAWVWARSSDRVKAMLAIGLVVPALAWAALHWDARTPQVLAFERAAGEETAFGTTLPREAQVFWEPESLVGTWLVLGRPSYFSYSHLAGQMFNRGTFVEGRAREARMLPLMLEGIRCRELMARGQVCHISVGSLRRACAPDAQPGPGYLVLPYAQPQRPVGEWQVPGLTDPRSKVAFRLYSCAGILRDIDRA